MDSGKSRVIYLVRHGKVALEDGQRRYVGQLDVPLAEEGRRQARAMARRFAHAELTAIWCSDLSRCRETAAVVGEAAGVAPVARPDLREIAMGDWEGLAFHDVARRFPEAFRARGEDLAGYRTPGGESFADCSRRAVAAFEELAATTAGNVLLVGHAGVNRLILCHLLGMPVANLFRLGQDPACLDVIQHGPGGFQVRIVNGRVRPARR